MYPYAVSEDIIIQQAEEENEIKRGISRLLDDYLDKNPKEGYLKFQVTSGSMPISGSEIVVSKDLGGKVYIGRVFVTDIDGKTLAVSLPAPGKELSLSPGGTMPYATYDITVSANGYLTKKFYNVAVFEGVISVQPVALKPDVGAVNIKNNGPVYEKNFKNL